MRWKLLPFAAPPVVLVLGVVLGNQPILLAVLLAINVAAAALYTWHLRRPLRRLDRLFWLIALRPIAALPEGERRRRVDELATLELDHPVLGRRRFPAPLIERRLGQLGKRPLERLLGPSLAPYRDLLELHGRR